jgi:hypothetical protein
MSKIVRQVGYLQELGRDAGQQNTKFQNILNRTYFGTSRNARLKTRLHIPDLKLRISQCSSCMSEFSGMLSRSHEQSKRFIKVIVDLVALAAQATGFVVWPLLEGREKPELWLIPFTVILISCGWWENYVNIPKDSHSSELMPLGSNTKRYFYAINEERSVRH